MAVLRFRKQFEVMQRGGLEFRPLAVDLWIPAGFENPAIDPQGVSRLFVSAHELELDDWAALFEVDIYGEPRGMLIADMINYVSRDGFTDLNTGLKVAADPQFSFPDLTAFLDTAQEIQGVYQDTTIRSIRQRVGTYSNLELFSGPNTPLRYYCVFSRLGSYARATSGPAQERRRLDTPAPAYARAQRRLVRSEALGPREQALRRRDGTVACRHRRFSTSNMGSDGRSPQPCRHWPQPDGARRFREVRQGRAQLWAFPGGGDTAAERARRPADFASGDAHCSPVDEPEGCGCRSGQHQVPPSHGNCRRRSSLQR